MYKEFGVILSVSDNVVIANGLDASFVGEVVTFEESASFLSLKEDEREEIRGIVMNLEESIVRVVLFKGDMENVFVGQRIFRTFKGVKTVVGMTLLGTIIDPLGEILDTNKTFAQIVHSRLMSFSYTTIFRKIPGIIDRQPVRFPFITGIIAVDCFLPIGLGQRELIIGDLNTGKTSLAVTMILNQRFIINNVDRFWRLCEDTFTLPYKLPRFTPCLYLLIGKRRSEVIRIQNVLLKNNAFHYTCIIYAGCDMKAAMLYVAPYAVTSMGEWFMYKGYNPVMVFDDLSEHAVSYRQISLLLRRPPGREAYPGDIFFLHSKLLERSAQLRKTLGGGSLTCIPVIETKMGDISAFIPTNVISITDGQIFLSKVMLNKSIRPAIYLELSVSRVGSNAQYTAMKEICNGIKRDYRLFKDFEVMSKVTTDLDPRYVAYVERGFLIRKLLKQRLYQSYTYIREICILYCIRNGFLDDFNHNYIELFFALLFNGNFMNLYLNGDYTLFLFVHTEFQEFIESLLMIGKMEDIEEEFVSLFDTFLEFFQEMIIPKLQIDFKKAYIKGLMKSAQKERKHVFV